MEKFQRLDAVTYGEEFVLVLQMLRQFLQQMRRSWFVVHNQNTDRFLHHSVCPSRTLTRRKVCHSGSLGCSDLTNTLPRDQRRHAEIDFRPTTSSLACSTSICTKCAVSRPRPSRVR